MGVKVVEVLNNMISVMQLNGLRRYCYCQGKREIIVIIVCYQELKESIVGVKKIINDYFKYLG